MKFLSRWFRHEIELWEDIQLWFAERRRRARRVPAPPYTDPEFGTFVEDDILPGTFTQERDWFGAEVDISLAPEDGETLEACIDTLRSVRDDWEEWDRKLRQAIIEEYYQLWSGEWRNENDPELSPQEFCGRFEYVGLDCLADGSFAVMMGDGGLFNGHGMSVEYDADERKLYAALVG